MTDECERREGQTRVLEMVTGQGVEITEIKRELDNIRRAVDENRARLDAVEGKQSEIKDGQREIITQVEQIGEDTGALRELAGVWSDSRAVVRVTKASGKAVLSVSAVGAALFAAWHFITDLMDQ